MITAGKHTYLGNYSERFDPIVEIGNFSSIGSGAIFYGTAQHPQTVSTYPFADKEWCDESVYPKSFSRGPITIGGDVWIGEDVRIMDGVTIGDGAIVGAGAVVSSYIPSYTIAVGNTWKVAKMRFPNTQIADLLKIKWWNWDDEKIKQELPYMKDIETFIRRNL
jgi:acetyltransferase-like isoleucine patch superfamily enzyme